MTSHEVFDVQLQDHNKQVGEQAVALQVALITDLGPNNAGTFGPADEDEVIASQVYLQDLARPEYSRPASNRWICVDGRTSIDEAQRAEAGTETTADPQIGGSLSVSETAASYMAASADHQPLSLTVASVTHAAVADGLRIGVHGDTHKNKAGCAANAQMRGVLGFMVANADIILPTAWELTKVAALDDVVSQDDLAKSIVDANLAVENESLWDATPEEVVDIAVANGAEYIELQGSHSEKTTRADMSDGAFAKAAFVRDHSTADKQVQAFSASFGAYASETLRRADRHQLSRRDAGLQIARVFMYNIALTKKLKNDAMPVGVLTAAS